MSSLLHLLFFYGSLIYTLNFPPQPTCISLLNRKAYVLMSDINYLPCIFNCFLERALHFGHMQAEKKKRKAQLQEALRKKNIKEGRAQNGCCGKGKSLGSKTGRAAAA